MLVLALLLFGQNAISQVGIPDSARPGAARPDEIVEEEAVATELPTTEELDVPTMIERPLDIDEGERVAVREFRLVDAEDMPEYGISIAGLQEVLQGLIDVQPEGFTVGQLQLVADEVTAYYRDRELILAVAVVPVQTVTDGVVNIQVMPGLLGQVIAEGNDIYSEDVLVKPFQKLIGKPVTNEAIESALLSLTDFPGLTVFGVFQPGIVVGTADIVLNVQDEKRFEMAYRVDNQGVEETGRYRFRPRFQWNNITGSADNLQLLMQMAYEPKNNVFYSARYNRYLGYDLNAEIYADKNKFDVGGVLKDSNIRGQTTTMGGTLFKTWKRGRYFNLYSDLDLARKESITTTRGNPTNKDRLSVASLGISFDHVDTRFRGINSGGITFSRGFNNFMGAMGTSQEAESVRHGLRAAGRLPSIEGRDGFAEGEFNKVFANFTRLQTITTGLTLQWKTEFQWTDDLLVPLEQYSIGGPDNLRAYPSGQHLVDRALFSSIELIQNVPFITDRIAFGNRTWGELIAITFFYDFARGRLVRPFSDNDAGNDYFMGAGVQATFNLPGTLESRFIAAWEIDIGGGRDQPGDEDPRIPDNGKKPQIWGDFTYRF